MTNTERRDHAKSSHARATKLMLVVSDYCVCFEYCE